jgi:hypothetical protein
MAVYICIYIQEDLKFSTINLQKYYKKQDLEIAAIKIKIKDDKIIIFSIYRAPSDNFGYFISELEKILNSLHTYHVEFIICGDIYKLFGKK